MNCLICEKTKLPYWDKIAILVTFISHVHIITMPNKIKLISLQKSIK